MNVDLKFRLENIEKALNLILPKKIEKDWQKKFFKKLPKVVSEDNIAQLVVPCRELMTRGGKRWRPLLSVLSCEMMGGKAEKIYPLTPLIELCHTASLIHDDIEDNSSERRGDTAIHLKYGVDRAINAGSWLYFQSLPILMSYSKNSKLISILYNIYGTNLRRLHLGQAMDISWHSNPTYIPTKKEYLAMTSLKTGSLARLAGSLGIIAAGKSEKKATLYGNLMCKMGLSFQIIDDVKNISSGIKGKDLGDDVVEGKKSLPVILYLEKKPEDKDKILGLFEKAKIEGVGSSSVNEFIQLINSSDSLRESKKIADNIMQKVLNILEKKYPENDAKKLLFELFNSIL